MFYGKENKDLFMLTMVIGYQDGNRVPLDKKDGFILDDYLNEKDETIIKAIAIAEEGDLNVLTDKKKVYEITEEYAARGIALLKGQISEGRGTYTKRLESDLVETFEKSYKRS